jgi:hypothetical protein
LMAVAFGDGSTDLDKTFPARLTKGAPGLNTQEAISAIKQINPNFNEQQYRATAGAYKTLMAKDGDAIGQFNNAIQHSQELAGVLGQTAGRNDSRLWNSALNKLQNLGYGTEATKIQSAVAAVKGEYSLLLSGGYKPSEDEQKAISAVLDPASTPGQISAALKTFGNLGATRLDQINEKYHRETGKNVPSLVSKRTLDAARSLGLDDVTMSKLNGFDSKGTIFGDQTIAGSNKPNTGNLPVFKDNPAQRPAGTSQVIPGPDGKMYYADKNGKNLGLAPQQ